MTEPTIQQVVDHYLQLRDYKDKLTKEFDEKIGNAKKQMESAENWLLNKMNTLGVTSLPVEGATALTSVRFMPSIGDKAALMDYIRQSGDVELLQSRVSSTAVKEYRDRTGDLPPGVHAVEERVVSVRRK